MAVGAGKTSLITVDAAESCLRSSGLSLSTDMLDTTCFTDLDTDYYRRKITGLKDGSLSLEGDFDPAGAAQVKLMTGYDADTEVAIVWYPFGSGASFTFSAYVESVDVNTDVEDKVTVTYNLSTTGAVTYAAS